VVPRLRAYVEEAREYAPSRAPVFYNPVMELNRDLAVLALQAHQRAAGREVSACEPLAGCGVRGVRLAVEVEGVKRVVLGDINPRAVEFARLNVDRHKLGDRVEVFHEDANLLLSRHAAPRRRLDYIDVDPFGSPAPYLDSAIRALRSDGLLALTATDLGPLCGVHPRACLRKYGGRPLRTEYCHELAVRLLVGCLAATAARHDVGVSPVFSHSTDHYVRAYALLHHGRRRADDGLREMGHILHCFGCLHRETTRGPAFSPEQKCPECGSRLNAAGPLWLGKISDGDFCSSMRGEAAGRNLKHEGRILRLLSMVEAESGGPATYHVVDRISDSLNLPTPSTARVMAELEKGGFLAVLTHFHGKGFRTDAPAKAVREVVRRLAGA